MASTFTPNKSIELPANNDYVDDWDVPVNADFTVTDTAFGGLTTLNATSISGNVTLTLNQYQPPTIVITGTLTAPVNYQLPAGVGGFWSIYNNTTGAFAVTLSSLTGAGASVTLPQGYRSQVLSDQTNIAFSSTAPGNPAGSTTQVQYNNAGVLAGSPNLTFNGSALSLKGTLALAGSSSGNVGFAAPATSTPTIWTLPAADGTAGQVLSTNGSTILSWSSVAGGGSVTSFNGRMGTVTLLNSDVTGALGYTPAIAVTAAEFAYSVASGAAPDSVNLPAGSWHQRGLNTTLFNTISGASLASNQVTLPAGTYLVNYIEALASTASAAADASGRIRDVTASTSYGVTPILGIAGTGSLSVDSLVGFATFSIGATHVFEVDIYPLSATITGGIAASTGENEVYVRVRFEKIA